MSEAITIALGSGLIQAGILIATVKFLRKDVNGLGKKQRSMMAEQIIMAQDQPKADFAVLVRKLINGI